MHASDTAGRGEQREGGELSAVAVAHAAAQDAAVKLLQAQEAAKRTAEQLVAAMQEQEAKALEAEREASEGSGQGKGASHLPEAARALVGAWWHIRSEGYGPFLSECVGLSWATKKIGERIHPTPMFYIRDGQLVCETVCLGADPVLETFVAGPSIIDEPNLGLRYEVDAWWEADDTVFVASRRNETVNGGRPIVKRVYIEQATGELHIDTSWGGSVDFNARFSRESRS